MKGCITFILFIFFLGHTYAQTFTANFTGAAAAIPGTSTIQKCFPVTVTGVAAINTLNNGLAQVCINIIHPNTDELEIVLVAPDGTIVPLSIQNGGSGNNYTATCFSSTATQFIKFGASPFTGNYLPEGHLGAVNNGQNANGVWNLCIQDRRTAANAGSLTSYSITFNATPAPAPPALPACTTTLPGTSSCANATAICDFSGLCGNTTGTTIQDWAGSGLNSCFGIENNSFVKFIASGTSASFSVWVPTNTIAGNYNLGGIQMLFFSGTCNSGAVTTYGCYPHIYPYSSPGNPLVSVVAASGLTPGNTYYLMIDGFNSDKCTFTIEALSGVSFLNINPPSVSICQGQSVNLTASGGDGTFSWSPSGTLNTATGPNVTASPSSTTTYSVTSTGVGSCPIGKDVTVTVNQNPAVNTQPSAAGQNICINGIANPLSITATAGSGSISAYQWYSNTVANNTGGMLISGAVSNAYTPQTSITGTLYYYCIISNSNACSVTSNVSGAIIIHPALAAPVASVTQQPLCSLPTGTITVSSPTGLNYQYSIGGAYQNSGTFSGLVPNSYNITAQDIITGCISPVIVITINPIPIAPVVPVASVTTQPSCTLPSGTITVTVPLGVNFQYSIGGAYQGSAIFPGLIANSYPVTVKDMITGCISSALSLIVNAAPGTPATPQGLVTSQPSCSNSAGTISILSPAGANIQYSIGGAYQSSGIFTGLLPNAYNITVKDIVTGCLSSALVLTVNPVPLAPITPVAFVANQPSCLNSTGSITVNSPLGTNLQYSIGGAFQASINFTGLAPNNYQVTVMDMLTGCISPALSLTVNPISAAPSTPVGNVIVQPGCTITTGTIEITSPVGVNLQYSIGGLYQNSGTFPGLLPNSYPVSVKDVVSGCISPVLTLTVNPVPVIPVAPIVTSDSRCGAGLANLTASGSGVITWYSESALINPVATGLVFGPSVQTTTVYYVTATLNNCSSAASAVFASVNPIPTPSLGNDRSLCPGEQLVLNPGSFSSYLWQDNSTLPTYTASVSNTYTVTVSNNFGCKNSASVHLSILSNCNDIYFPTAFTPNGDYRNDEFGPLPLSSLSFVKNYKLSVYNRYGQLVFFSVDPFIKWSGKFQGHLSTGNFTWYSSYNFKGIPKLKKGNIMIIR